MQKLIRNFFADKNGKIVLWQTPNLPLAAWIVLSIANAFAHNHVIGLVAKACIVAWALLEIKSGASYFRRTLGLVVLVWSLSALFG